MNLEVIESGSTNVEAGKDKGSDLKGKRKMEEDEGDSGESEQAEPTVVKPRGSKGKRRRITSRAIIEDEDEDGDNREMSKPGKTAVTSKSAKDERRMKNEDKQKDNRRPMDKDKPNRRPMDERKTTKDERKTMKDEDKPKPSNDELNTSNQKGDWRTASPAKPCEQCSFYYRDCGVYTGRPKGRHRVACAECNNHRIGCSFLGNHMAPHKRRPKLKVESEGEDFGSEMNDGADEEEEEEEEEEPAREKETGKGSKKAKDKKGKGKMKAKSVTRSERAQSRARSASRPTVTFEDPDDLEWVYSKFWHV